MRAVATTGSRTLRTDLDGDNHPRLLSQLADQIAEALHPAVLGVEPLRPGWSPPGLLQAARGALNPIPWGVCCRPCRV